MRSLLFLVIPSQNLRLQLSAKLGAYFADSYACSVYDRAQRWWDSNVMEIPPDLVIIEWLPSHARHAGHLCKCVAQGLGAEGIMVILRDPPEMPAGVATHYQTRVISYRALVEKDLPTWLGLDDSGRFIIAGQLVLQPALDQLITMTGVDPDAWPGTKLEGLRLRVLEFLMLRAQGPENAVKADIIMDTIWLGREAFDVRSVQDVIRGIRRQIEPDPRHPIFLKSRNGRRKTAGYYIEVGSVGSSLIGDLQEGSE